jgi:hypothetical protein
MGVFETMTLASVEEEDDILVDFKEKKAGMISNRKKKQDATSQWQGQHHVPNPFIIIHIHLDCMYI